MAIDGGLWSHIQKYLHHPIDHQRIETGGTGRGIPDLNSCRFGIEVWIELKETDAWAVTFQPGQIGWAEKRTRAGGRVFLLTRRKTTGGPRKGPPVDELWLHAAMDIRYVAMNGLKDGPPPLLKSVGGPSSWDWKGVEELLFTWRQL